jgi:hypothetical protein
MCCCLIDVGDAEDIKMWEKSRRYQLMSRGRKHCVCYHPNKSIAQIHNNRFERPDMYPANYKKAQYKLLYNYLGHL